MACNSRDFEVCSPSELEANVGPMLLLELNLIKNQIVRPSSESYDADIGLHLKGYRSLLAFTKDFDECLPSDLQRLSSSHIYPCLNSLSNKRGAEALI